MRIGLVGLCGVISVVFGFIHLLAAGAPRRYLLINAAALAVGLACAASAAAIAGTLSETLPRRRRAATNVAILVLDVLLFAPLFLTEPVHGASRWLFVAGLSVQPSLLLLPAAMALFARCADAGPGAGPDAGSDAWTSLGMTIAAIALALQPDRAMAGALAAGMTMLAFVRPERVIVMAWIASGIGFATTWLKPDNVPPAPYVEQVLQSSFELNPLVGLAVVAGLAIMLVPAVLPAAGSDAADTRANRDASLVFGATWLAIILAAAFGNYPTPLVGYGSSAIIGYFLCSIAACHEPM